MGEKRTIGDWSNEQLFWFVFARIGMRKEAMEDKEIQAEGAETGAAAQGAASTFFAFMQVAALCVEP